MIELLLWSVGVPLAIVLVMVLVLVLEWVGRRAETATTHVEDRLAGWRSRTTRQSARANDRAAFLQWLSSKAGADPMKGCVDETILEAQRQSALIRILLEEELPEAASRCVQTHRLMAETTGVDRMVEIAYESETYFLRGQMVWLLGHTVEFLEQYPLRLNDIRLLHNSIILRKRALPTCQRCPYILLQVDQLPDLCPTAELFQIQRPEHGAR